MRVTSHNKNTLSIQVTFIKKIGLKLKAEHLEGPK
jgi:hypothetical protein